MYFCQLNCIFLTGFVLSKCTAKIVRPTETTVFPNEQLCPDPTEFESSDFYSSFHQPNNVLGIYMSNRAMDSHVPTCQFKTSSFVHYDITLKMILQKHVPVSFASARKCSEYFELLSFGIEDSEESNSSSSSFGCTAEDDDSTFLAGKSQFIRYFNKRIQLEIQNESEQKNPVAIVVFKVESINNPCFFQVQQYYMAESQGETKQCNAIVKQKLSHQICGTYNCMERNQMIQELDRSLVLEVEITRPVEFFLKGFILPGVIVVTGIVGYLLWKRRMKNQQRLAFLNNSTPQGTQTDAGSTARNQRNRRNWNMHSVYDVNNDDEYDVPLYDEEQKSFDSDDPPPPYQEEVLPPLYDEDVTPPTYDEAMLK